MGPGSSGGARLCGGRAPLPQSRRALACPEGDARAGAGAQASSGLLRLARAWPASVERVGAIYREPADRGCRRRRPRACGEGDGTVAPERAGAPEAPEAPRPPRPRRPPPRPGAERGCGSSAGPGRVRRRRGPGARSGAGLAGPKRSGGGRTCWKPGARGTPPSTARISRMRKQQARPGVPRAPSGASHRGVPARPAPPSRAAKVQAPHQRPAGCSRRGRARSRPPSAPTPRSAATGGAAPGAGCSWAGGERWGRGEGAARGRRNTEAQPRAAAAPLGHQRGLRGAGSPGAGGGRRGPMNQPRCRPRSRAAGRARTAGPWIAQRPDRRSPVASRRCLPLRRCCRSAWPWGSGGRAAAAAAAAAENRARGRDLRAGRGAAAPSPPPGPARPGSSLQAENLRGLRGPRTVPPPRSRSPRLRRGGRSRPGPALPRAARPAGPVAAVGRADRWGRRQCAPRLADAAAPARGAPARSLVLLGRRRRLARRSTSGPRPLPSVLLPARRAADAHWAAEGTQGTPAALQRPRLARRRVRRGHPAENRGSGSTRARRGLTAEAAGGGRPSGDRDPGAPNPPAPPRLPRGDLGPGVATAQD